MIEAIVQVHSSDVIPNEYYSLTASGKLSTKTMSKTRFNELYQDYVCSCLLRIAREIFVFIPLELIIVTAKDKILDTKTGYLSEQPICSALIPRETIEHLNLNMIDPSDSMQNFNYKMKFKKSTGFEPVEQITRKKL